MLVVPLQAVLDERTRAVEALIAKNERHMDRSRGLAELRATLGTDPRQFSAGLGSDRDHLEVAESDALKHVHGEEVLDVKRARARRARFFVFDCLSSRFLGRADVPRPVYRSSRGGRDGQGRPVRAARRGSLDGPGV